MPEYEINDICRIFHSSWHVPAGVFSRDRRLISLYSDFGQRQLEMYLGDAQGILITQRVNHGSYIEYDRKGSLWGVICAGEQYILCGPVQSGENNDYGYGNVREFERDVFVSMVKNMVWLILGEGTPLTEKNDPQKEQIIADNIYRNEDESFSSFDELFECVRDGDITGLNNLLASGEFGNYQNRIMREPEDCLNVYTFTLAKTYHTALESGVPISELSPLVDLYLRQRETYRSPAGFRSACQRILYDFTKYVHQYSDSGYSRPIAQALMYIREHIYGPISIPGIAKHCSMSVSSLQHRFHEETGETITSYILSLKMEKASYFLKNTSLSCTDIAYRMGYSTQSYFIRQFRKATGVTPLQYRQRSSRENK